MQRPTVGRFSFQDIPVLAYTINTQATGDNALSDLRRNLEDNLVPELKALPGVNSVSVMGGGTKQVQITYDQSKLDKYGLTASNINGILQANNISFPTGEVVNNGQSIPVRVDYQFNNISDLQNLVVMPAHPKAAPSGSGAGAQGAQGAQGSQGGSAGGSTSGQGGQGQAQTQTQGQGSQPETVPAVKLSDVATVALVNADEDSISRSNGKPSLSVTIYKTQNANTVSVSDAVAGKMQDLGTQVPGAQAQVLFDQASFIKDSLNGLIREGLLGALLAIIVILIFLGSLRSTLVTAVSIPLSVLIALTMFNILGVTLNIMSLAGLAVAIGRVVDDSIVVLENIYRHHFQQGEPIRQAAFNGTKEVATSHHRFHDHHRVRVPASGLYRGPGERVLPPLRRGGERFPAGLIGGGPHRHPRACGLLPEVGQGKGPRSRSEARREGHLASAPVHSRHHLRAQE